MAATQIVSAAPRDSRRRSFPPARGRSPRGERCCCWTRALAGNIAGIDAFIGGHSHTLLSDSDAGALGPAHQAFEGPNGRAVVAQAACFGRYVGRLDLDIGDDGTMLAYGGDVHHVGLDTPEEPRVAAIVAGYAAQLDTVRKRLVARAPAPLGTDGCRVGECPLGDIIADAMGATTHGAEMALMNAGGIRTGLPGGDVTLGDVLTMLPFGNTVATLKLSGADLRAALANGVARADMGAFPRISGARITWRPNAAPGERLVDLSIQGTDGRFAPLEPERIYPVVTNDFVRRGGDGYTAMKDRAIDPYDSGQNLDEAVTAALPAALAAPPAPDGRISALP